MSDDDRNWRDAKMPQWVKDAIQAELDANALTVALSWPTEAKPQPMPFRWGEYDNVKGTPIAGKYWTDNGRSLEIREKQSGDVGPQITSWKSWVFRQEGYEWSTDVQRGPLFATQHDAKLAQLWSECEKCAQKLLILRKGIYQ